MSVFTLESLDYDPLNVVRRDVPERMSLRLYGRAARCVDYSVISITALFQAAVAGDIVLPPGTPDDAEDIFGQQLDTIFERVDLLEEYGSKSWRYCLVWWMAVKAWL